MDTIVIGSGFGGAVLACRLAERGERVLVLERGRRWTKAEYPRKPGDAWVFDHRAPHKCNGWIDLRVFRNMAVVQGAGVGGGSLIYANVSIEAKPILFLRGWPPEISYLVLKPHYETVGRMLSVQTLPDNQLTARYKLMKEAADALGYGERFQKVPLAVRFDPAFDPTQPGARTAARSTPWINDQQQPQGTCVHLGYCDIGCPVHAKNTLDLNYLAAAEQKGAEIRPLHRVTHLAREANGYRVHFERVVKGSLVAGSESAKRVVLAAGSLGSTEILLRSRDEYRTLPRVSPFLGRNWSSNGDFLTPAFHHNRLIEPYNGPTITSAIDFLDKPDAPHFFIEDGGFPDLLGDWLGIVLKRRLRRRGLAAIVDLAVRQVMRGNPPLSALMPWFSQGIDAANGELFLSRDWLRPWRRRLNLKWDISESKKTIDAIVDMHVRLAKATGGEPRVPAAWKLLLDLITPHPLGGCNMGRTADDGVVDFRGQVFNYPNLFVADGAIVPEALGLNPSRTIAALAEHIAGLMV
jgi:cholesterol oxidase